jgi:hypothetical protein
MDRQFIVKLESFEGRDTYVQCGNDKQDYLYCVVSVGDDGDAEIVDNGYRSLSEAAKAWPDALNAKRPTANRD